MSNSLNQSHYSVPGIFFHHQPPMPPSFNQQQSGSNPMTVSAQSGLGSSLGGRDDEASSSINRPPSEQLYESASIIYGPVGYLGDGGKPSWFQNGESNPTERKLQQLRFILSYRFHT